jgi:mannose-6-phosphate isomerase
LAKRQYLEKTLGNNRYHPNEVGIRPWGRWVVLDRAPRYCIKRIEVEAGHRLSLQYHLHRIENWVVIEGAGRVQLDEEWVAVASGSHIHVGQGVRHRIHNDGTQRLVILELQRGDILDEEDIIRIEDDYAR